MHGLMARALESFVRNTYGDDRWAGIARDARIEFGGFELMLDYPTEITGRAIDCAARHLSRTREEVLEDIGLYLVSHPAMEPVRRLLRYGGADFLGFLESLGDLPERTRLGLPHLSMPPIDPVNEGGGQWSVYCGQCAGGLVHILHGAIRGMADDYGALAVVDLHQSGDDGPDRIRIAVLEDNFTEGRRFDLKIPAA